MALLMLIVVFVYHQTKLEDLYSDIAVLEQRLDHLEATAESNFENAFSRLYDLENGTEPNRT